MFIELKTSAPNSEIANLIAGKLVEAKLAACVQISGPILSHYIWEGKKEVSEEYIIAIKSKAGLTDEIAQMIKEIHPYELPELIATEIASISPAYTDWMNQQMD